jgi:Polysaccharide biosynthesis enzyme WcbI
MAPKRIAVLGNCQAQMIEGLFLTASPGLEVDRLPPNFELGEAHRADISARLAQADIIFAQRVAADYPQAWLRTVELKAAFPGRVVSWPNIYFDGYSPDVQYVYLDGWGKLQSPLEDYHLARLIACHKAGRSAAEAMALLTSHEADSAEDPFRDSLDRLRAREAETDIPISDFLEERVREQRCFYTPNHPYTIVLSEMCRRLAHAAGLAFDRTAAAGFGYDLDRIYLPAYPAVVRRYGLPFDRFQVYRGVDVISVGASVIQLGLARSYLPDELVERYYRIYDRAFAC